MTAFEDVLSFVESELGFATSHYDASYLSRRMASRMRRTGTDEYSAYFDLLREDEREQTALLDALSINVTSFFRNPDVWAALRDVLDSLPGEQLRFWSAACSDGREPYSLAMLTLEEGYDSPDVEITATDIDAEALNAARRGVYRNTRTTDIAEQLAALDGYERYVERTEGEFTVRDRVRELVRFERHDLIHGEPKSDFDLVTCRNLFIYINAEHKLPMLRTITASLRDRGYLVIGKTETLPDELKSEYEPVDKRLRIYRKPG